MKLTIIGTGYVGLVTGVCFSEMGNTVYCVDVDKNKIDLLNNGVVPIYEPGLKDMIDKNIKDNQLFFTADINKALSNSNIYFICVGTPTSHDGSADLRFVWEVAENIGKIMKNDVIVVIKSTVPVGTASKIEEKIQKELDKRGVDHNFHVVSNPEFLREGSAISETIFPDRIIIGADDKKTIKTIKQLYLPFSGDGENFIIMDNKSAEMTKYASNAILATRISFINEIANICELVGANINKVRLGVGSDKRIGYSFLNSGTGYGGSCFPKDVKALIKTSELYGHDPKILKQTEEVNKEQKQILIKKVTKIFGEDLKGKTFAIWGLSFKPETDDMREAPSIEIINGLIKKGAKINAYDPIANNVAKKVFKDNLDKIKFFDNGYDVLDNADALLLVTEWKNFKSPDFDKIAKKLKNKIIFDGRNQYDRKVIESFGFEYYPIGY